MPGLGAGIKCKSCQQFNQRILKRNWRSASATLSSKHEIGQNRNIVVEAYRFAAIRAARSGKDDRLLQRDPVNAYVEKTADYQAEQGVKDRFRSHPCILDYLGEKVEIKLSMHELRLTIDDLLIVNRQSQTANAISGWTRWSSCLLPFRTDWIRAGCT
jgi:hypothetical protein